MHIDKVIIKNYRTLKNKRICFNKHLNIIVGDNETGKSTLLEAVNLALTSQINGKNIQYDLHPFLFNADIVKQYIDDVKNGKKAIPPKILIEIYFEECEELIYLKGINNSLKENACGISYCIEFDESFNDDYQEYIKDPQKLRSLPVEFYTVKWLSFSYKNINQRSFKLQPTFIDSSTIKHNLGATKYVINTIKEIFSREEQIGLSLSYRLLKDSFLDDETVKEINDSLSKHKEISEKTLSISLDTTSKNGWEYNIIPQLNEIPLSLIGKGEQNSIKIILSIENSPNSQIFLIEEPENHQSHSNLNSLINKISQKSLNKQIIITTHSSFVLNKLGLKNIILFTQENEIKFTALSKNTYDFFMKLPGYDTLRLILSKKVILVEGSSDELIVQKAFIKKYGHMPLECGVDIISINSLAFKRYLEIADLLNKHVIVITDNDGNIEKLKNKYKKYLSHNSIKIVYDPDINYPTLEPQLLKENGLQILNDLFNKNFNNDLLLQYMAKHKTSCALKIFNSQKDINIPKYILDAI